MASGSSFFSAHGLRYRLAFGDDFEGDGLDRRRWLPHDLPHWSLLADSRARFHLAESCLTLRFEPDQGSWCPALDPGTRVSHLQTGQRSGPLGSAEGKHRFRPGLVVREALAPERRYLPHFGAIEMRARADLNAACMAALWLLSWQGRPGDSGEIAVMEVIGRDATAAGTRLGHGTEAITDPRLATDLAEPRLPFRAWRPTWPSRSCPSTWPRGTSTWPSGRPKA